MREGCEATWRLTVVSNLRRSVMGEVSVFARLRVKRAAATSAVSLAIGPKTRESLTFIAQPRMAECLAKATRHAAFRQRNA